MLKSLKASDSDLTLAERQIEILESGAFAEGRLPTFEQRLRDAGLQVLEAAHPEIFQVNVGYMCNQVCKHCHVDAGPDRKEIMDRSTMELCLEKIREFRVDTVDITGGAPEMNPDFRWFVSEISKTDVKEIIVRSNLTIILANPKYHDLPHFFKEYNIRVISSLPYYNAGKTDRQRGDGVFDKSVRALRMLNEVGYAIDKNLILDLVYNPGGAFLPGDQKGMEADYKKALLNNFNIRFNQLFVLTNLPVNRFLDYLIASGNYDLYMDKLVASFNPQAVSNLMCKDTLSIDYRGFVHDCDFNQMLQLQVETSVGSHLSQLNLNALKKRKIRTGQHCYGCTAGAGSSCQGTIAQ